MKKFKYVIISESFNENVGGYIALHKLCDELNRLGYTAKIMPAFNNFSFNKNNIIIPLLKFLKERIRRIKKFKTNPEFITPKIKESEFIKDIDSYIAIYPETISGNPINAKHVVRWFLHSPGFHNKNYFYNHDELYFKFHSGIKVPEDLIKSTSKHELYIIHYPLHLYNNKNNSTTRNGSAYAIRKGVGKKIIHDLTNSINIDGKSHEEIAKIFKSVNVFYSYDPYTAFSTFAVLCGCDSVVIPDDNISIDEWIPDKALRAGIAYGINSIEDARKQRSSLINRVELEIKKNSENIQKFTMESSEYFSTHR